MELRGGRMEVRAVSSDLKRRIEELHALYVQLTGLVVRLDMQREGVWWEFIRRGNDAQGLREVVAHLRRGISQGKRNVGALKFSNLIGQVDFFEEDLAEALQAARIRKSKGDPARNQVLRDSTGGGRVERPARSVREILLADAGSEARTKAALEAWNKLKESLSK